MLKITITGAESSGKTTLSAQLAAHFKTLWSPEYARFYLAKVARPYVQADLLEIAKGQIALEDKTAANASRLFFADTSLEVIKVWSEVRFGTCHPWISEQMHLHLPDFYLLCQPDLPWSPDPLRENPHDRDALHHIYKLELAALGVPFFEVKGKSNKRFRQAASAVENFLNA